MKDIILKILDNKWLVVALFTLLAGGNIGQAVYTGHNPEVLQNRTTNLGPDKSEATPMVQHERVVQEVIIKDIPDATISRICREAVNQHENGRWH